MNNQKNAEELLEVLMNSEVHNPAWALKEVLEKLREQLSKDDVFDEYNDCDAEDYTFDVGWMECLRQIYTICNELEKL